MGVRATIAVAAICLMSVGATTVGIRAVDEPQPIVVQQPTPARAEKVLLRLEQKERRVTQVQGRRAITVRGSGSVSAVPDVAHARIGVEVRDPSARVAWETANEKAARVIRALRRAGVAKRDMQTSDLSLYRYRRREFRAENELTVTIRALARAGDIIGAAADAAGKHASVGGIWLSVDDKESLQKRARRKAIENGLSLARQYARAAGVRLGAVLSISEGHVSGGRSSPYVTFDAPLAPASVYSSAPIQAGRNRLSATVTMVFALR